jgi:Tfp pilus assembly protein PilF
MAVELDPEYVEARASLGCVLVELQQNAMAEAAFRGALEHHPDYPDVHFHLARLLDQQERPTEALDCWRRFLQLAPRSPWADEARERLGMGRVEADDPEPESPVD